MPLTLKQLSERTARMASKAAVVPSIAAERLAPIMIAVAKEVIGTHILRDLMESTQTQRQKLDLPPNEPLLREGDFRESIEGGAIGPLAFTGTNDPRGTWFEWGTTRMLPFSNFQKTQELIEPIALEIGEAVLAESMKV